MMSRFDDVGLARRSSLDPFIGWPCLKTLPDSVEEKTTFRPDNTDS